MSSIDSQYPVSPRSKELEPGRSEFQGKIAALQERLKTCGVDEVGGIQDEIGRLRISVRQTEDLMVASDS